MIDPETGEIRVPFLRTPYNYDMNAASDETAIDTGDESLVVQSEKDNCDINVIVERFIKTGNLPPGREVPDFADFVDGVYDYHTAVNMAIEADDAFMALDARVRARFRNDPQELMEFLADDKNREEAVKLGLVKAPPAAPEPLSVRVVGDPLGDGPKGPPPVSS